MSLLIKLGFMAAHAVILFEHSSSTLWIRPLFLFVVVSSTVSGQIRLPQLQEICLHCFCVDSSTVVYKAWIYGCFRRRIVIFLSLIGLTLGGHYMKYLVGRFVTRMRTHVIFWSC